MERKTPAKNQKQAKVQAETDSDEDGFWEKQKLRHQWAPSQIDYVKCDSCDELADAHVAHQMCGACAITICRDCVQAGNMSLFPTHPQMGADELDWERPSVTVTNVPHANNITPGIGSGGHGKPASATPVRQRPAGLAGFSSTTGNTHGSEVSSVRKNNGKAVTGLNSSEGPKYTQTTLTSNRDFSLTISAPMKKPKKSPKQTDILIDSDSDSEFNYDMDAASANSSDKEYLPRSDVNRKHSSNSLLPKKAEDEAGSVGNSVNNTLTAPVGLANSRPVRAAAIQTYEKMRRANIKKQCDAEDLETAFAEEQKQEPILKMTASAQDAPIPSRIQSAENFDRDSQDDGYAQQGAVFGGNAYLYAPEYAQMAAGRDVESHGQADQHQGFPKLHPGSGSKGQFEASEPLVPAIEAIDKKRSAAAVEEAPSPKRQNTSTQSFAPAGKAELTTASDSAIKGFEASTKAVARQLTPAERDANRIFVTAGLDGLAAAIEHKVRLRLSLTGANTELETEIELRNAVHGAWISNMALTHIKRTDGVLAAMQILRGFANVVVLKMQIIGTGLIKNWIDATEKDMQENATFVPTEQRIEASCRFIVEPVAQKGLEHKIGETEVYLANALVDLSTSSR